MNRPDRPLAASAFSKAIAAHQRLGLGRAALEAAVSAEFDEIGHVDAGVLARVIADVIDANNAEMVRQIKYMINILEV